MSPEHDPGDLWARIAALIAGANGRVMVLIASAAILLTLYPDEVIRAAIGAAALLLMKREIDRS